MLMTSSHSQCSSTTWALHLANLPQSHTILPVWRLADLAAPFWIADRAWKRAVRVGAVSVRVWLGVRVGYIEILP